jgi:uncharacterized Zn-binding protein involved in type VI secretion
MAKRLGLSRQLISIAALGFCAAFAQPAAAQNGFDGMWSIQIVADQGDCRPRTVSVQISDGKVSFAGFGATAEGDVVSNGRVNAAVTRGEMVVTVRGALDEELGSGRWRSSDCRGSWTARRH